MIWLAATLLIILALLGLTLPWWSPRFMRPRGVARRDANVAAYRERLAQLPSDVSAGPLSAQAAEELKAELAARLLQDAEETPAAVSVAERPAQWLPFVVAGALVVFTAGAYVLGGSWRAQSLIELARTDPGAAELIATDRMIAELEGKVKSTPDDAENWIWLGRHYRGRDRAADAAHAFERANELKAGQDPDVLAEWGETLALTQDRKLTGAPAEKFEQALKLAPENPRALLYAGAAAMQAGDDRAAIAHWERLLQQQLPHELKAPLELKVQELRERIGLPAVAGAKPESAPGSKTVVLHVLVKIKPELLERVAPTDTVFVYATDPAGPPMPLAVQRFPGSTIADLSVQLTDADSPMPTRKLSSVDRWRVIARVSRSGNAMPQSGDLEGSVEVARNQAGTPVGVLIDRQRP